MDIGRTISFLKKRGNAEDAVFVMSRGDGEWEETQVRHLHRYVFFGVDAATFGIKYFKKTEGFDAFELVTGTLDDMLKDRMENAKRKPKKQAEFEKDTRSGYCERCDAVVAITRNGRYSCPVCEKKGRDCDACNRSDGRCGDCCDGDRFRYYE